MITVTIPTLMMAPVEIFKYTLSELCSSALIEKILVIDNSQGEGFSRLRFRDPKVECLAQSKNIFVNPAWNLGLAHTRTSHYLILNDDVLLSKDVLERTYGCALENPGAILTVKTLVNADIPTYLGTCADELLTSLEVTRDVPEGRIGWFILGETKNWEPIPSELNIFYGDDFIYRRNLNSGRPNLYIARGAAISHYQSSSVMSSEFQKIKKPIADGDHAAWPLIRDRYRI